MSDSSDAQSARAHIQAAFSAPHRADLELTQAQNYANLIDDRSLKNEVTREIEDARRQLC